MYARHVNMDLNRKFAAKHKTELDRNEEREENVVPWSSEINTEY